MKRTLAFLVLMTQALHLAPATASAGGRVVLLIHGGAGVRRADVSPEREKTARAILEQSLRAGHAALTAGGGSLDAVEAAIQVLEDAPEFNAGRGSALTSEGVVEMDASIMDGAAFQAGAVAGVTGVRSPIKLARLVMTATPHVLLIGAGAERLAREHDLPFEAPEWFVTPRQQQRLERERAKSKGAGIHPPLTDDPAARMGTVGAVALDAAGNLAAGTSTGGMSNKLPGRVGDSPIIGAGTYAENKVCAVSCTGHGEYFIRGALAHEVAALMKHAGAGVGAAARAAIHGQLQQRGGTGGMIALDHEGRIGVSFNTEGMFHGWITSEGEIHTSIFEQAPE
jgi:beta-aspartyl-peptidase (threonine type)